MEYTSAVSRAGRRAPAGVRLFFWVLLAVSAAVRCVLACFPKAAYTYADELVYLELAQNIWLRGSLSLLHAPTNFSKILYPLLISPFYAITAPESRSIAISIFNALLTSSALIPGYLLARKFLRKPGQICAALLALALAPELMFSMTYMAECLYIPLALWVLLFFVSAFENGLPSPARSAAGGGLLFLLYLAWPWPPAPWPCIFTPWRHPGAKTRRPEGIKKSRERCPCWRCWPPSACCSCCSGSSFSAACPIPM